MGLGGGVPAQPEYGPIRVEGFTYEFRDKTLNCPKCEDGRAFFRVTYCTNERQEWLQVLCHCGFAWNELPADLDARIRAEVLDHFKSRADLRAATAGEVNAIRQRIFTAHLVGRRREG